MYNRNVLKIAFIGTDRVGKTLLCNKIIGRTMDREYISTIGVDLMIKYVDINNENIGISLWDLAGQKRFETMLDPYINKCNILFFCFSTEDYSTFQYILNKIEDFNINRKLNNKIIGIIATKTDSNKVCKEYKNWYSKLNKILKDKKYTFFDTSVYNNIGIDDINNKILNWTKTEMNNKEHTNKPFRALQSILETCQG